MKGHYNTSILCAVLLFLLAALLSVAPSGTAGPVDLTDAELANVTGQAGVTIWTNGAARVTIGVLKFSDTDSSSLHWLEFHNFVVDNGKGGYFSFSTPIDLSNPFDPANPFVLEPVTIDVETILIPDKNGILPGDPGYITTHQTLVATQDSTHVSPRWYSVGDWDKVGLDGLGFVFCDQSLGTLNLDALSVGPSLERYGAHADGTAGIDYDYSTRVYAQAFRYTYNSTLIADEKGKRPGDSDYVTTREALTLSGIHLAGSAVGTPAIPDDPTTPSTWVFSGNFKIGNIDTGHPATIDVGTDAGITSLYLNLPMQGTLRVEKVIFGTNTVSSDPNYNSNFAEGAPLNFGPIAIDGINVHHLNVKISGGS